MFKRGVVALVLAAMLAMLSTGVQAETRSVSLTTNLKNPVVKSVVEKHGKVELTLTDETDSDEEETFQVALKDLKLSPKSLKALKQYINGEDDEDSDSDSESEESVDEGVAAKKIKKELEEDSDDDEEEDEEEEDDESDSKFKGKKVSKRVKQISEEKKENGEVVRKYAHGSVRIMAKNQQTTSIKKAKKEAPTEAPKAEDVVEKDLNLTAGESVSLEFGDHNITLTVLKNGSLVVDADDTTYTLPKVDEIDLDIEGAELVEDTTKAPAAATTAVPAAPATKAATDSAVLKEVKSDLALAAKKFTELATTVTGDTVSKDAAPVVFVCGLVGALAAIVGVAAVALGRVRHDDAAEDPQSVLADAAVEDVEAGIQAKKEDDAEDAPAEKKDELADSDSDSDVEEGQFANDATASV